MTIENQINELKKEVSYDTRDFTIELIVKKYKDKFESDENEIYVPEYQRDFIWDETRQSKMIESIMLGLPIPSIFIAETKDGRFEIVDGSQRIRTLSAYIYDELEIQGLKKITNLNKTKFSTLDASRQRKFKNTALSIIVLAESSSEEMKNDLFERINKGADLLRNMEARKGIYQGGFTDFIYKECAENNKFKELIILSKAVKNRQEYEELILRFFALIDNYPKYSNFARGVGKTLDDYMKDKNFEFSDKQKSEFKMFFEQMVDFVSENFKFGFSKNEGAETSRMIFEAISVGVHFALKKNKELQLKNKIDIRYWLNNNEFRQHTSGKYRTHSALALLGRIDFVSNKLLEMNKKS